MSSGAARWLAPAAAGVAVLVAVLVPGVLSQPGSGGAGPGPDKTPDRLIRTDQPDPLPGDRRDSGTTRQILVTGYQTSGRDLTVFYRLAPRGDCSTGLGRSRVTESSDIVAVRLLRTVPSRPQEACAGRRRHASVVIRLSRPLGERVVQDAARRGALVPLAQPDIKVS